MSPRFIGEPVPRELVPEPGVLAPLPLCESLHVLLLQLCLPQQFDRGVYHGRPGLGVGARCVLVDEGDILLRQAHTDLHTLDATSGRNVMATANRSLLMEGWRNPHITRRR